MNRPRTLTEYRTIDLLLLAGLLAVFEFIIVKVALGSFFHDQAFTVSLAAAITTLVYMRWGWWGGLHAALAGVLFCFYYGAPLQHYLIYALGNLFSLLAVPWLKRQGPQNVRDHRFKALLFPLMVILLMQGGRALISLLLGAPPGGVLGFFTTDALSTLFTLVILWIARRLDGVYEDQIHYLLRLQEEKDDITQ